MSAEIINNRAEDGNERESKRLRKAKANPSEVKSEMVNETTVGPFLDGEDIGHLLLKANFIPPKPCNPEKNKLKKVAMHDDEDPRGLDELFPDIPHGYVPPKIVDRGPCWICDGPHSRFICDLLDICPIDRKVPERYKVACDFCCKDAINVINGKCPCGSKTGRVVDKVQMYYGLLHSRFMFQDAKPVAFDGKLGTKRDLMKLRGGY